MLALGASSSGGEQYAIGQMMKVIISHLIAEVLPWQVFTTINALRLLGPTCVAVRLLEMLPGQAGPMGSGGSVEIGDSVVRTSGSFMIRRNTWLRLCVS